MAILPLAASFTGTASCDAGALTMKPLGLMLSSCLYAESVPTRTRAVHKPRRCMVARISSSSKTATLLLLDGTSHRKSQGSCHRAQPAVRTSGSSQSPGRPSFWPNPTFPKTLNRAATCLPCGGCKKWPKGCQEYFPSHCPLSIGD